MFYEERVAYNYPNSFAIILFLVVEAFPGGVVVPNSAD